MLILDSLSVRKKISILLSKLTIVLLWSKIKPTPQSYREYERVSFSKNNCSGLKNIKAARNSQHIPTMRASTVSKRSCSIMKAKWRWKIGNTVTLLNKWPLTNPRRSRKYSPATMSLESPKTYIRIHKSSSPMVPSMKSSGKDSSKTHCALASSEDKVNAPIRRATSRLKNFHY